jgi:DNA polymerase I-like protein with 3'-5' exonuclease and polymerase domains
MKILTIDFETYYDQEYSLTKLTTEEYIRGDQFEVIGVAVQEDDGEPKWFSGTRSQIKQFLETYDFPNNLALAHNAMFDAAILSWHFGICPRGWLDTLSIARAVHSTEVGGSLATLASHYGIGVKGEEVVAAKGLRRAYFHPAALARYGAYCCNDVALTYSLFQHMGADFPKSELRLIDLTIKMFSEPTLHLDTRLLKEHLEEVVIVKNALLGTMDKDTLMSNAKFADWLRERGVEPPMKISPTTGKQTYAFSKTDEAFKALLEHRDIFVQAAVVARLGVKSTIEETRTERFIGISERGSMPVPLRYYAAHTGRWGGDDKLNLQNIPRSSALKKSILAPEGYVICDSDSSQIEARTLAWLAEQDDLVGAFEKGEDVYKIMASAIYGKSQNAITKDERFVGKTTILGSGYGMGATKFKAQLRNFNVVVGQEEAQRIVNTYRDTYPHIPELWRKAHETLDWISNNKTGEFGRGGLLKVEGKRGIRLPNGMYLKYPNLRKRQDPESGKYEYVYDTKKGKTVVPNRIYGGKVVENVCQALARIIIGEQMLMVAKKYRVVMTVHDAIACLIPMDEAENGKEYVELCMRLRPSWAPELPLNCEAGYGKSYGDC